MVTSIHPRKCLTLMLSRRPKPAKDRITAQERAALRAERFQRWKSSRGARMARRVARVMAWVLGGVLVFVLVLASLAWAFQEEITQTLVDQLNVQLVRPIEAESVELNVVRHFPSAAINFRGLRVPDAQGETLVRAEGMRFRFNALRLLSGQIRVYELTLNDGLAKVAIDAAGKGNFEIWRQKADAPDAPASSRRVKVDINRLAFKNMVVKYDNRQLDQRADVTLDYVTLSGNLDGQRTALKTVAELQTQYVEVAGDRYLPRTIVGWDMEIAADLEAGTYAATRAEVVVMANRFGLTGEVKRLDGGAHDLDLALKGEGCTIQSVLAILPDRLTAGVKDFNSRGDFHFEVAVQGALSAEKTPAVVARFGLRNGEITSPRLGESLRKASFEAELTAEADRKNAAFVLKPCVATLDGREIAVELGVKNAFDPRIDFRLNGALNLGLMYRLLGVAGLESASGLLELQDLILIGRLKDMLDPSRLGQVEAQGIVNTQGVKLRYAEEDLEVRDGYLTFTNELVTLRALKVAGMDSDFELNANLYNVIPVLLAEDAKRDGLKIVLDGELKSQHLNFDRLLALGLAQNDLPPVEAPNAPTAAVDTFAERQAKKDTMLDFTTLVQGRLAVEVADFNFRKVRGTAFKGRVRYDNREIVFDGVQAMVFGGGVLVNSNLRLRGEPQLVAAVALQNIDAERLLREAENFGQSELTDKNLKGTINAKVLVRAYWDAAFKMKEEALYVLTDVTITQGELVDYEMMKQFSKFVKLEDLERIVFTDLRNQLQIKNRQLTIPTMFIQSNALNMTLAGTYDFDHNMDFKFKINAGQVLAQKFRRFNTAYLPKPAKRRGWFNIYVGMAGNVMDMSTLKYDYTDKRDAEARFAAQTGADFGAVQREIAAALQTVEVDVPTDWDDDATASDGGGEWGEF